MVDSMHDVKEKEGGESQVNGTMTLGPNSLTFSSQQEFLTKESNKHDTRRISARHTPLQKGSYGCCAVEKHVY